MVRNTPLPWGSKKSEPSNRLPRSKSGHGPSVQRRSSPCGALESSIWLASPQKEKRELGTNVDQSIERRNSRRFQIALPLLLRWTNGVDHYDAGHCVNIGQGGMFVLAAKTPPVGSEVEVEFVLPAFGSVPRPTRLHCVGRVSRVETCYQLSGFAVAGQFVGELQAKPDASVSVNESPDVAV